MPASSKVLVIGLGISGCSAARFLLKRGCQVSAVDKRMDQIRDKDEIKDLMQNGLEVFSENCPPQIHPFDLIVVSPGVPPSHPLYQACISAKKEVIGEIELAGRFIHQKCLGITGSNGKTTTTLLVEHALNHAGKKAKAVGNIGKPLTQVLDEEDSREAILVIELSSWQLETLQSKILDAAVIINITPNHLDRHKTMEAYAQAKFCIGHCLKTGKKLYASYDTQRYFNHFFDGHMATFGYNSECDIYCDEEKIIAQGTPQFYLPENLQHRVTHDVENIMAAYVLCQEMGVSSHDFSRALFSFKKPPHRIEFIRKYNEVSYYDDSKATSIDPVIKAVNSLLGSVILIAGGVHKGFSYKPWVAGFKQKVRLICAIGEAAEQIQRELSEHISVEVCLTLEEAVCHASKQACPGENILLSPGCSSLDMFKDYEQRGDAFKKIVWGLEKVKN